MYNGSEIHFVCVYLELLKVETIFIFIYLFTSSYFSQKINLSTFSTNYTIFKSIYISSSVLSIISFNYNC